MESVFQYVGACGCFQVLHVMCVESIRFLQGWSLYQMVFDNYQPPWECVQYRTNWTATSTNGTVNDTANMTSYDETQQSRYATVNGSILTRMTSSDPYPLSANGNVSFRQGTCDQLSLCDEIRFDPTSVTLVTDFGLICDRAYIPSLLIAIQMCGMVVGANLGGQLGEAFGRKVSIYSSLALMSVTGLGAAWSVSWQMYAGLTFFNGVGGGGIGTMCVLYSMEFLTPKWRGRLAMSPTWYLSQFTNALVVTALKNWRQVHMVTGITSTLMVSAALFSPESLRWLKVHGKDSRARKVLSKMMKFNSRKENVEEVFQKFQESCLDVEPLSKNHTCLGLFRNKNLRILTAKASLVGFLIGMTYYTLGFSVKALSGNFYTNLILSGSVEFPFLALVILSVNRFGRKFTITGLSGMGALCTMTSVIAFYVTTYDVSGPIIAYLGIFAKGFAGVGWVTFSVYGPELFPTAVRSVAMGFVYTLARIGTVLGATLIPRDTESLAVCFIVLCVGMLVTCVVIFSLPETKGKPLEDEVANVNVRTEPSSDEL